MSTLSLLLCITVAALAHASFQLSISVLTLLSGHAIGKQRSHRRLLSTLFGFLLGSGLMTAFLLITTTAVFSVKVQQGVSYELLLTLACGLAVGVGVSIWLYYFRRETGTSLWIPRRIARYLAERAKKSSQPVDALSLGLVSTIAELIFLIAPISIASLFLMQLSPKWQVLGAVLYILVAMSTLCIVSGLVSNGYRLSHIQRWREQQKRFLQFAAGSLLVLLGLYSYVEFVLFPATLAAGGLSP